MIGQWGARYRGRMMPCAIGAGGIGVKAGEGDQITPLGQFQIEAVWARRDRIGFRGRSIGLNDR